jgi:hypothetical protein
MSLMLCDAPVGCTRCCTGDSVVPAGRGPRQDSSGKQICELCPIRLSRAKGKLHRHGPGHICTRCYNQLGQPATAGAAVLEIANVKPSRKRRATSDPGESPEPASSQALTRRVNAPEPASTSKKQYNTRREEQITRLLDETHARRMAAEGAAAATGGKRGATHTGFTLAFVP